MIYSRLRAVGWSLLFTASTFVSAQELSKPALRDNLDDLGNSLHYALPYPGFKSQVWNFGEIAEPCKYEALSNGLNPGDIFTYNITYDDCAIPYVVCFHRDFPTSFNDGIFAFSKVPPRMRQYVRTISFHPGGGAAYARGSDIVMLGTFTTVGVYIHEVTHSCEFSDAFKSPALMADQQPWSFGYNQDTAVPDHYARNNQRENLAQHPMFILYNDNIQDVRKIEPNYNRISGQQYILRIEGQDGKNGGGMFDVRNTKCSYRHPFPRKVSTSGPLKRSAASYRQTANATFAISKLEYKPFGIACIDPNTLSEEVAKEKTSCRFGHI